MAKNTIRNIFQFVCLSLLVVGVCAVGAIPNYCAPKKNITIPPCNTRGPRDILFIVDASESLSRVNFYTDTLDYLLNIFCSFSLIDKVRTGLILFNNNVQVVIPLKQYTREQWFEEISAVRMNNNSCCSKGTPMAEAFLVAREEFERNGLYAAKIAFTVTDGHPFQLFEGSAYPTIWPWPKVNEARYWFTIVPAQAEKLKQIATLMLITVPRKDGLSPKSRYFIGLPDPDLRPGGGDYRDQCVLPPRGDVSCGKITKSIVSNPSKDFFSVISTNPQALINATISGICKPIPVTKSPTTQPSLTPTASPNYPDFNSLDLFVLLDRSRSMRWVPNLCRNAPGVDLSGVPDFKICWMLFLNFARQLVSQAVNYISPRTGTALNWQNQVGSPNLGLRVTVVAFWCSNNQEKAEFQTFGVNLNSQKDFEAAMMQAQKAEPDGGTCPHAAIDKVVSIIQDDVLQNINRLYKAAVLFTDGVFYDGELPKKAGRGLNYFNVLRFALGIALPIQNNEYGLTPAEVKTQRKQLRAFVGGDASRVKNLGEEGFNLLALIAGEIIERLAQEIIGSDLQNKIINGDGYCGFATRPICEESKSCKYNERLGCLPWNFCKRLKRLECEQDKYCYFPWSSCQRKKGAQPPE